MEVFTQIVNDAKFEVNHFTVCTVLPIFTFKKLVHVCFRPGAKKGEGEDDLPAEYLASPLSKQSQVQVYGNHNSINFTAYFIKKQAMQLIPVISRTMAPMLAYSEETRVLEGEGGPLGLTCDPNLLITFQDTLNGRHSCHQCLRLNDIKYPVKKEKHHTCFT